MFRRFCSHITIYILHHVEFMKAFANIQEAKAQEHVGVQSSDYNKSFQHEDFFHT